MSPTAHELVARGAELLDEKLPGWADQIDLDTLALHDSCACVLGQLGAEQVNLDALSWHRPQTEPAYDRMTEALGLTCVCNQTTCTCSYGFDRSIQHAVTYDELQDAWKGEIVARRTL